MKKSVYKEALIGKRIAIGAEHLVYRYGDDQVVKFPRGMWYWLNRVKSTENMKHDQKIIKQYFSTYLIDRDIVFEQDVYTIIEPFLQGRHMRRRDLLDPAVKKQFLDILERNSRMTDTEDMSLEFFGLWGLLWKGRREVANVMLEENTRKLVIVDPGVLRFGRHVDHQILSRGIIRWVRMQQHRLLAYYRSFVS